MAIDPVIGRMVIGVNTQAEADALRDHLLLTYTYGAVGPVGAHPQHREPALPTLNGEAVNFRTVSFHQNEFGLNTELTAAKTSLMPTVIEIMWKSMARTSAGTRSPRTGKRTA